MRRSIENASQSSGLPSLIFIVLLSIATAGSVSAQTLQSISVTTSSLTIPAGQQKQFTAIGFYSDGSSSDVTNLATWSTSKSAIANVNTAGLATAKSAGTVRIGATYSGLMGSTFLTVSSATLKSVAVSPNDPTVAVNFRVQFSATGTYSDGSSYDVTKLVTWSSTNATITKSGLATGSTPGVATITASATGATSGSTSLTIKSITLKSISVTPVNTNLPAGKALQYTATGTFSDGSTANITVSVAWSSSSTATATIGSSGLARAVAAGSTTVTARHSGVSNSTALTVTPSLSSISVFPSAATLPLGLTQQFKARANYSNGATADITTLVSWSSSAAPIATISNSSGNQGLATSVSTGTTNITAAYSGVTSAPTSLTVAAPALISISVSPQNTSIALGTSIQFSATGTYTNGTTKVITGSISWSSSTPAVAEISGGGLAVSGAVGAATITASLGSISGTGTLYVTPAALVGIGITPSNPTVPKGGNQQFVAMGTYTDGSTQNLTSSVQWMSSDFSVATINSTGNASAVSAGTTQITATIAGTNILGQTAITVGPAALLSLAVTPSTPSVALGTKQQFVASGTYTDGSTQDLTSSVLWASADTSIVSVSIYGQAFSEAVGSTTISATSGSITGSTRLTVTPATLVSIAVTPAIPSVASGEPQQFAATGTFTDGSIQDITNTVGWSSSNPAVATISMTTPTRGLAQALATGSTIIAASSAGVSGNTTLTVTPAVIISIAVTPSSLSLVTGTKQLLSAKATFSDNSTQDITSSATWSSTDITVAAVNESGLVTALQVGSATITAASSGVTGSTSVQVTPAVLGYIVVSPSTPSTPLGTTQQFTATGNYSDGTTQDLTSAVQWASSDATIANISMAQPTIGVASSVATGTVTITATIGSVSGIATLTITPAALVSIAVTPATPSINLGQSQQFIATGAYTDGSKVDITSTVNWSTSDATVAIISNTAGSNGLATSSGIGAAAITATLGQIMGTTTLTINPIAPVAVIVSSATTFPTCQTTVQFSAVAAMPDNTTIDVTQLATWYLDGNSSQSYPGGIVSGLTGGVHTVAAVWSGTAGSLSFEAIAPAQISDIVYSNITETSFDISWTTNVPSNTQAFYAVYPAPPSIPTALDPTLVLTHLVSITGVNTWTLYYVNLQSTSVCGITSDLITVRTAR